MVELAAILTTASVAFNYTDKILTTVSNIVDRAADAANDAVEATFVRDEIIEVSQSLIVMANAVVHSSLIASTTERDALVQAITDLQTSRQKLLALSVIETERKVTADRVKASLTIARIVLSRLQIALHAEAEARAKNAVKAHDKKMEEGTAEGIPINQGLDKFAQNKEKK